MADDDQEYVGASSTQIMFHAIQSDNVDLLKETLNSKNGPNLEGSNSIGDSPILACLRHESLDALAVILEEEVDVDVGNAARDGDRPLHLAVRLEDEEQREWCVNQLLEAGSDPRMTNTEGLKPVDLISPGIVDDKVRKLLREAEAMSGMRSSDVVDEDDESDGGPPSDEE
ncbi:hypothetical protein CBS101457_004261 [Exobasidium rhododendri]|nr:hypothetical protein CBS101457_004261 [Exobasidium rhododendri]